MSKLYDVINRLEEVAAREGENPEIPAEPEFTLVEEKRSPVVRILFIAGICIVLGLSAVGGAYWWKNSFPGKNAPATAAPTQVKTEPAPPLEPSSRLQPDTPRIPEKQFVNTPATEEPETAGIAFEEWRSPATVETPQIMSVDVAGLNRATDEIEQIIALEPDISPMDVPIADGKSSNIKISKLNTITIKERQAPSPKPTEPPPPQEIAGSTAEDFTKTTRWLHQAEIYRHQGEWDGAITLYKRVFNTTRDPAVANNLAAALIETRRIDQAHKILQEAALAAPDDPDIKQNLQVIQQMLDIQ